MDKKYGTSQLDFQIQDKKYGTSQLDFQIQDKKYGTSQLHFQLQDKKYGTSQLHFQIQGFHTTFKQTRKNLSQHKGEIEFTDNEHNTTKTKILFLDTHNTFFLFYVDIFGHTQHT